MKKAYPGLTELHHKTLCLTLEYLLKGDGSYTVHVSRRNGVRRVLVVHGDHTMFEVPLGHVIGLLARYPQVETELADVIAKLPPEQRKPPVRPHEAA